MSDLTLTLLLHCAGRVFLVADLQALTSLQQPLRFEVIALDDPDPALLHAASALHDCEMLPMVPLLLPAYQHEYLLVQESVTCPAFPRPRPRYGHEYSLVQEFSMFPMDPPAAAPK